MLNQQTKRFIRDDLVVSFLTGTLMLMWQRTDQKVPWEGDPTPARIPLILMIHWPLNEYDKDLCQNLGLLAEKLYWKKYLMSHIQVISRCNETMLVVRINLPSGIIRTNHLK